MLLGAGQLKALREAYECGGKDLKEELEKQYGRATVRLAVEEGASMEWLSEHAKPCPSCKANTQHIDGCNKMTCYKCRVLEFTS